MTIELPKPIDAYFAADREGSPDAVAAAFTEAGIVKDERKVHRGREAIRAWRVEAGQLYSHTTEPFSLATDEGRTRVMAHVAGTFPGSPLDLSFSFVLSGDRIAELEITL
ncbi:polyketide cyclase [Rhizobium rhizosphaerae]|uniref:Polyketide cyclase n=1 Tax=Xaviernesmea rhizosphaerae TaxID=1672749 RepID=A0ABX3PDN6_9HYPH|nr:nuclear transport factor 2 family protein [Xaviernesmea rhizosphaerae]OQP86615.1 polyketide cyclase [Xaviernesmea rhizosphaerae]